MSSPHSERGRRTVQAEVTADAKKGVPTEHSKGKLLGMAKEYGICDNGRRIRESKLVHTIKDPKYYVSIWT